MLWFKGSFTNATIAVQIEAQFATNLCHMVEFEEVWTMAEAPRKAQRLRQPAITTDSPCHILCSTVTNIMGNSRQIFNWRNFKCPDGNPAWDLISHLVMLLGSKKLGGPWLSHLQGLQGCINAGGLLTSPCSFPYALLQTATSNFSSSNLLGEGSFGHVYKARLDYGVFAAVKRLTNGGQQGEADFQVNSQSMTDSKKRELFSVDITWHRKLKRKI